VDQFVEENMHHFPNMDEANTAAALKTVHAKCVAACKEADAPVVETLPAPAPPPPAKGDKK
jgi:hypothetical protein